MITELTESSPADLQDLEALMHELSSRGTCTESQLRAVIEDGNSHLFILRESGHIVACATLCVSHTPEGTLGGVESVVVSSACRGKGYGRLLMEHLLQEATRLDCHKLHLTSRPSRVAANRLYQSLGFVLHETNCYQMRCPEMGGCHS